MPLNTITRTTRQIVHDTRGWNSVQVGEMTDLWLKRLWDYVSFNSCPFKIKQSWCFCSLLFFGHFGFLFNFIFISWIIIQKGPCLFEESPKPYKSRRAWSFPRKKKKFCQFLKNKTKHTYFVLNAQSNPAHVVQASPSVLYKLQKSLPVASTGHGKLSF